MSPLIDGGEFRRLLGWGRDRFYKAAKSGRFAHLVAINVSSTRRVVYVRAKVDAWIGETSTAVLGRSLRSVK